MPLPEQAPRMAGAPPSLAAWHSGPAPHARSGGTLISRSEVMRPPKRIRCNSVQGGSLSDQQCGESNLVALSATDLTSYREVGLGYRDSNRKVHFAVWFWDYP